MISNVSLDEIKKQLIPILKRYDIQKASLFGSVARGESTIASDIDILIELSDEASLLDFIAIKNEIEEKLGHKIDLVEFNALKPALRSRILKDQVVIL
ncbi:MAG: nucleotidyltransferase family protein [Promethearchaeota archaeon]